MYQYSLEFFIRIFKLRLQKAENPSELNERLDALITDLTRSFYLNICRGLFEKDKLQFSFLISTSINLAGKAISQRDWVFFIKGQMSGELQIDETLCPSFFTVKQYTNLLVLADHAAAYKPIAASLLETSDRYIWN